MARQGAFAEILEYLNGRGVETAADLTERDCEAAVEIALRHGIVREPSEEEAEVIRVRDLIEHALGHLQWQKQVLE